MAYERSEWFCQARFGMFIHWGIYAIPGRGEWVRSQERITVEDYQKYFDTFEAADYDPVRWAKLARRAGMKYMVLTAKHHDGFCLFDSALTDYKSTNTPCGRDLVREFLDAARGEGLRAGLYYSLLDWHHPDYPHYGDLNHPMRDDPAYGNEGRDFGRYLDYMHGQVEELCRDYGKLDLLWFDFSYEGMCGETWRAKELVEMVRSYQPDVLMDNRLEASGGAFGSLVTKNPTPWSGDFISPEQVLPPDCIRGEDGGLVPWELCLTMNNNWGYHPGDRLYKSAPMLVRKLVECVSKGGNMILNVGPDARGLFPDEAVRTLEEIGRWMDRNHESVTGCGFAGLPKPEWGRYTRSGKTLYAHIEDAPVGPVPLTGVGPDEVESITLLRDGSEIGRGDSWATQSYPDTLFASLGEVAQFTYPLPDEIDTVLKIRLK